jgi:diacylglycerol kinase
MNMISFFKSCKHAFCGIEHAFRLGRNIKIQLVTIFIAIILGLYVGLKSIEWIIVLIASGNVLTAELFNTAVERLCDEVTGGNQRVLIKSAKDISAGAVLISALLLLAVWIVLIIIPIFKQIIYQYTF